jgi:transposase InsO family protein
LIKLVQAKYQFTKDEIIKYVKSDVNTQLMKPKPAQKLMGHITSLAVNELMQMDIFDLQRYKESNKLDHIIYPYLLVIIDVFSRYANIEPLENKTADAVLETFKKLVERIEKPTRVFKKKSKANKIRIIISDNEGSFQSKIFEKYLDEKSIILSMNALNDHHVLGIIDNFAKRLKTILTKFFLLNRSTRWLDIIDKIINQYNNTKHIALNGLTPSQATQP